MINSGFWIGFWIFLSTVLVLIVLHPGFRQFMAWAGGAAAVLAAVGLLAWWWWPDKHPEPNLWARGFHLLCKQGYTAPRCAFDLTSPKPVCPPGSTAAGCPVPPRGSAGRVAAPSRACIQVLRWNEALATLKTEQSCYNPHVTQQAQAHVDECKTDQSGFTPLTDGRGIRCDDISDLPLPPAAR